MYVKGCPAILVPARADWGPTARDRDAPPVLPKRTCLGRLRESWTRKTGKPLYPPPASLARAAPPRAEKGTLSTTYAPFASFYLPGKSKRIANGFQPRYPAHIMVDHDVSAADWDRFLADIRVVGKVRPGEKALMTLCWFVFLPCNICCCGGAVLSTLVSLALLEHAHRRHIPKMLELIELYQYRFFRARGLDVFVACGATRLTGHFPGDKSYVHAPPVEVGAPPTISTSVEEAELIRRVPTCQHEAVLEARYANRAPSAISAAFMNPQARADASARRAEIRTAARQRAAERRADLRQERLEGVDARQGRFRIVVQPLAAPPPPPPRESLAYMAALERAWGGVQPQAAQPAGEPAGEPAGKPVGEPAGKSAGEPAGEPAGKSAGKSG